MAPPLLYSVTPPKDNSFYVTIDLGANIAKMTGIFVPDGYNQGDDVDVLLWLMGHHKDGKGGAYPVDLTIDDYLIKYPHFRFREFVNASNKNVVLVAPTLGPHSEGGSLTTKDGFPRYIDQIMDALKEHAGFSSPSLGNLVIACHSGGGIRMQEIATAGHKYNDNINELWGFDCLYGDVEKGWVTWAQQNSSKVLMIRYGESTPDRSHTLANLASKQSNINVDGDGTSHNLVPSKYFVRFLSRCLFFSNR